MGKRGAIDQGGRRPPDEDAAWRDRVRAALAAWFERGHRALPWRHQRDPYRVLVSEMMLVQTTVAATVPYFERFLRLFPTVAALAAADEAEVLKAWEGLGYYRRCRQLHEAARRIVRDHGGAVPDDPEAIRRLPGVGRYVAGAVLSLAFDRPEPIVEANTRRVLARLLAWPGVLGEPESERRLWQAAERLVPPVGAGRFNEALMELGATVCTPREPSCLICPLAADCRARALGLQNELPKKAPKRPTLEVSEAAVIVSRPDGTVLILRRAPRGLWAGFWEFPTLHQGGADPAGRSLGAERQDLPDALRRLTGIEARVGRPVRTLRFGVTKYRVSLSVHLGEYLAGEPVLGPNHDAAAWERPEALEAYTFGSAQRRIVTWLRSHRGAERPR
jgi:A/G-specific adenine glycosylase